MLWNPLDYLRKPEPVADLDVEVFYDLGVKTGAKLYEEGLSRASTDGNVIGREVGDDRVDLCQSPMPLATALVVQEEVLKMKTSDEDTCIRKSSFNFCEVTTGVPTDRNQLFDYVRKVGDFSNMAYNDSIILRIITDVRKGDGTEHSSSEPGKMSMLGARLRTPRRDVRPFWQLASLFQDAMLETHRASEPKYMPPHVGGSGVPAPFDDPENIYLYLKAYKGGTYGRIYASATAELHECVKEADNNRVRVPVLAPRLREKQDYFHGTYDNMVAVPDQVEVTEKQPLYKAHTGQNRFLNYENRLLRSKRIIGRRGALVQMKASERMTSIFSGLGLSIVESNEIDEVENRTKRAVYDNALHANSALQNLLKRTANHHDLDKLMVDPAFKVIETGKRFFTREQAEWLFSGGKGKYHSLDDIFISEDMYVYDEVSDLETFKVCGIPLTAYMAGEPEKLRFTVAKVGLWKIGSQMEEWADKLTSLMKAARDLKSRPLEGEEMLSICSQDPEWVNDDSGLVGLAQRDCSSEGTRYLVLLVTADKRLCNQMANTANCTVLRMHPRDYILKCISMGLDFSKPWKLVADTVCERGRPNFVYVDTGSIAAYAANLEGIGRRTDIFKRQLVHTGVDSQGRYSRVNYSKVPIPARVPLRKHRPDSTQERNWNISRAPSDIYTPSSGACSSSTYSRNSNAELSWNRGKRFFDPSGRSDT